MKIKYFITIILLFSTFSMPKSQELAQQAPVRIGLAGLSHSHVHGFLNNYKNRTDIQLVGIAESDRNLVKRYAQQYGFDPAIAYNTIEEMVANTKPEGVLAFNSIYDHLKTVEVCAPKGIHVMVEKPLAVNSKHAQKMAKLARKNNTFVLTNYETSWYPTNHKAYQMVVKEHLLGDIRKVIVCDGHMGPKEIGCNQEFLDWLTDPVLNGGGAVVDFGCYGANLMTWLMKNERPAAVSAILQQIKPEIYPKVDDDATIIITYPKAQAILQASWNWPSDRKDIEIYGVSGYIKALNANDLSYKLSRFGNETHEQLPPLRTPENEPFSYFANIIRGTITIQPTDLASLENNLIVIEILDAARKSAKSNRTIKMYTSSAPSAQVHSAQFSNPGET